MNRIPIQKSDITIGKALPWNVFDPQGNRVAAIGDIIHTREHVQLLISTKACRDQPVEPSDDELSDEEITGSNGKQENTFTFEAMKLKVGDRLQIQPPQRLAVDRVIVRLIGYTPNQSLLVSAPRESSGLRMQLVENDKLVVRVFTSQNAFGFPATILKIIKIPYEYLHLSFPSEVKGVVIRTAPRVKTKIVCSVANAAGANDSDDNISGMIVNLSARGALLASRRAIAEKGESIKLAFRVSLHAIDTVLSINAVVRAQFVEDPPANGSVPLVNHGLEFVDLLPNDTLILQSMIYQQMIEQPHTVL
ncbi:flagellar brake protein [Rhodocyclus tenuis]|uniref:flagellar brake protein n=1 Tax=Rhodocyclus gracilis TaxID=2929842 RepID=UPI001298C072|nr:flagellar brake protein [Rhodocyclus gracilis]MRD73636.1 flagellar brake protein [Rhodocyclus gracilis]